MAISLETHGNDDDRYRVINYGSGSGDFLAAFHVRPEQMDSESFRTAVFDILWQLAGGKYD